MKITKDSGHLDLAIQVLIGALLGIFAGFFLGPYTKVLQPIGEVYVMLMQSVVYPYIIAALLHGLASLSPELAKKLLQKSWVFYIFLIASTFFIIWLLSLTIPESNSSIVGPMVAHTTFEDFLQRLVPDNLFSALVKNYMPAIIIFCLLFGSALQHHKNKESILETLSAVKVASLKVWYWIILISPYAAFALIAYTVGTISFATFKDIAIYLFLFFLGSLLLSFWFVPLLIISVVPITYKELMKLMRDALMISIATSLSVAALPYIETCVKKLIAKNEEKLSEDVERITETITTISYPFGQLGSLFLYLFIIFAAVYFQHPIILENMGKFLLMILTYFSTLGSPSSTIDSVSFLADWTYLPEQTSSLYTGLMPLTRYPQVLASVMGMAFISIVGTFAFFNRLNIRWSTFILTLLTTFLALGLFLFIVIKGNLFSVVQKRSLMNFRLSSQLVSDTKVFMDPPQLSIPQVSASTTLDRIRKSKLLRVGYNPHMIPFVYFNEYKELVGFDVAFMYDLAKTLGVNLAFIHFDFPNLLDDLNADKFDIAIGSIYVVPDRLLSAVYTQPYFQDQPAFIVKKSKLDDFKNLDSILKIHPLRIAVFNDPVLLPLAQENFPPASLVIIPNIDALTYYPEVDGSLWTQEHAQAWASVHPGYASVVSYGLKRGAPLLMAFMLRKEEQDFLWFLDYWLKIKETDGFKQQEYDYWLLGKPRPTKEPRWSILHNILHW